jgi:hypothetical protein
MDDVDSAIHLEVDGSNALMRNITLDINYKGTSGMNISNLSTGANPGAIIREVTIRGNFVTTATIPIRIRPTNNSTDTTSFIKDLTFDNFNLIHTGTTCTQPIKFENTASGSAATMERFTLNNVNFITNSTDGDSDSDGNDDGVMVFNRVENLITSNFINIVTGLTSSKARYSLSNVTSTDMANCFDFGGRTILPPGTVALPSWAILGDDHTGVAQVGGGDTISLICGGTERLRAGTVDTEAFGKLLARDGIGVGNSASATSLGSVTDKMQVYDDDGNSLGYLPIYDAIT